MDKEFKETREELDTLMHKMQKKRVREMEV